MSTAVAPLVEHVSARPSLALRGVVDRFVGYRMAGFAPGVHAGLPSRTLTFIISFDDPIHLSTMPDPSQSPASMWAMLGGLHDSPAQIAHDGNQHGIQLDVTPLGARALFGLPAGALARSVVPLDELLGAAADTLVERLADTHSWSDRFGLLDELLVRQLAARADRPDRSTRPELRWAWAQICSSGGSVRVQDLAEELGWSRRHLGSQFSAEFGLSPSTMLRVARFDTASLLLRRPDRPSFSQVAQQCGYSDQAHLTREWTRLAGSPPGAWLRDEEFPSVQDESVGPGGS